MYKHLLCNKVNIRKISGFDGYNEPIIGDIMTINGKLEFGNNKITNRNGEEVVSTGQLRLVESLDIYDQIDVQGVWRNIIDIIPQDDFSGNVLYYVVYF